MIKGTNKQKFLQSVVCDREKLFLKRELRHEKWLKEGPFKILWWNDTFSLLFHTLFFEDSSVQERRIKHEIDEFKRNNYKYLY